MDSVLSEPQLLHPRPETYSTEERLVQDPKEGAHDWEPESTGVDGLGMNFGGWVGGALVNLGGWVGGGPMDLGYTGSLMTTGNLVSPRRSQP